MEPASCRNTATDWTDKLCESNRWLQTSPLVNGKGNACT